MHIVKAQIKNYRSFLESPEIRFSPGFNVIVGQNNAGKTALAKALGLRFNNDFHRSLITVPTSSTSLNGVSEVKLSFELTQYEFVEILKSSFHVINIPAGGSEAAESQAGNFLRAISQKTIGVEFALHGREFINISINKYNEMQKTTQMLQFLVNPHDGSLNQVDRGYLALDKGEIFFKRLVQILRDRIYFFDAERLNIGTSQVSPEVSLASNASNLPQVLHYLLSSNESRWQRFKHLVSTIFPEIKGITIPPISGNEARILVWTIDPSTERKDLAVPLSESGTGIGQVLAILYVVVNSDEPRVIIIDEPQSFLHPGAIRKLFEILKQHLKHQYIITTHSPTAVTAANPQTLIVVRKEDAESTIEVVDVTETQKLRLFLSEIGARLSDVFGADSILWVEGATEEQCFPLILSKIASQPLLGTSIVGVIHTGDLEGKHSKTIFEIYERLSEGKGLLPPAIGFIFDKEGRSETEQKDLIRQSDGKVSFTARRMYENYLLNSQAIATIASNIKDFRSSPLTVEEIENWIADNGWNRKYFEGKIAEKDGNKELWLEKVHAAKILADIFLHFSETRVGYDKIEYGVALTQWIVENAREDLREIADLLKSKLVDNS
jgi:energy-coupling factor transporter ATP-binding protein EcfA2